MALTRTERKAQGTAAEERFRAWLDRCRLAHLYVEQSPFTFPEHLHGEIKRPDFLVGVPTIGMLAVDVKSKRIWRECLLIDAKEHQTLLKFELYFNTPVWFACFPPGELHACHLFLNRGIAGIAATTIKGNAVIAVPLRQTRLVDERRDFMAALLGAISLR